MFEEASKLIFNSTREENLARFPILSKWHGKSDYILQIRAACLLTVAEFNSIEEFTPRSVSPATAMRVLEELEREERELPDPPEPTGAGNAS